MSDLNRTIETMVRKKMPAKSQYRTLAAIFVFGVSASSVQAAWDAYPQLTAELGTDLNASFDPKGKDNALNGAIEGQLNVRNISETHNVQGVAAVRRSEYSGTNANDGTTGKSVKGGTTGLASIVAQKREERFNYGFAASYQSQPLLRSGVIDVSTGQVIASIESPATNSRIAFDKNNPDLDIGIIEAQVRRETMFISPNLGFQVSPRGSLQLSGRASRFKYSSSGDQFGLEDSKGYGASVQYQHQLNERTTLLTTVGADAFKPDRSPDADRYDVTLGISRQVSEQTHFQVEAGVGRSKTDGGTTDTVAIYKASLERRFQRGSLSLSASRDNWPTGFGEVVQSDQLRADLGYRLTERWELSVNGEYKSTNSSLASTTNSNDADYLDVESRIGYALTPDWNVGGAYRFSWADRQIESDTSTGNAVFAFVSYTPRRPF